MFDPWFPFSADIRVVLAVFAILLVAFDIILVRWLRVGRVAWKKVEYVWLGFAALGLFGAVSQARVSAAVTQTTVFQERASGTLLFLRDLVDLLSSNPGVICRTFVRSQYSPPPDDFERVQKEYNQTCEWIKRVASRIPAQVATPASPIHPNTLPPPPDASTGDLKGTIDSFYRQLGYYNSHVDTLNRLAEQAERNQIEDTLVYLSPFLIAVALALRITKVTGELKLDS